MKHVSPTSVTAAPRFSRLAQVEPEASASDDMTLSFIFANPGPIWGDNVELLPGCWVKNWAGRGEDGLSFIKRNGPALEAHDQLKPPIGAVSNPIEFPDGRLGGGIRFAQTPRGLEYLELYLTGAMSAVSVCFEATEFTRDPATGIIRVKRARLIEVSVVAIPADQNALMVGRSGGATVRKAQATAIQSAPQFRSLGEQLQAIARAEASGVTDTRLTPLMRAPSGGNEADPTSGGFAVEPVWASSLVESMFAVTTIAQLCDWRETSKPFAEHKIPAIDENSRQDGSRLGGTTGYWTAEGASVSSSFPRFRLLQFSGKKLLAVAYASNELVGDAPLLESHLRTAFAAEMGFRLDASIYSGDGVGKPLGLLNSPALLTVAAEMSQKAKTIVPNNIGAMFSALPVPCRKRAAWLVGEDVIAQIEVGASTGLFNGIYTPVGAAGNATPLLKGRPVIEIEQAPSTGTLGDIVLADLSQYIILDAGVRTAISAHVSFINDQAVFRFSVRVDGKPAWATPIAPYAGSGKRSPYLTLAAR